MIAGKTHSEILAMNLWTRCRWYKTIQKDEKEEAMRVIETARRVKNSEFMTEKWKDLEFRGKHTGKNHPMYGKIHTEDTKDKQRAVKTGVNNPMYGKSRPQHSEAMSGKNHPNWQGGKSFEPYGMEFNDELKRQIRSRDSRTCQECHQFEEQLGYTLDVHHIDYDKKNNHPENLISLCRSCHSQTNFGREDWTEYFGKIMEGAGG